MFIWSTTASNTTFLGNGGFIFISSFNECAANVVPLAALLTVIVSAAVFKETTIISSWLISINAPALNTSSSSVVK